MRRKGRYQPLLGTLWRHLKRERTSVAAIGVWSLCLSYCADNNTGGIVPARLVEGWCREASRKWRSVLQELLTPIRYAPDREPTPWLVRTDHGYAVHDYSDVSPTASEPAANDPPNGSGTRSERASPPQQKPIVTDRSFKPIHQSSFIRPEIELVATLLDGWDHAGGATVPGQDRRSLEAKIPRLRELAARAGADLVPWWADYCERYRAQLKREGKRLGLRHALQDVETFGDGDKRGPVQAPSVEDFDTSGDDFAEVTGA